MKHSVYLQRMYRLGCPVFATRSWVGEVLPAKTSVSEQLRAYTRIFGAVEGNSTFYALPTPATIERWAQETPREFRFAFKVPRVITHDRALQYFEDELRRFLQVLRPLEERLGPCMLQLPPVAGRAAGSRIRKFLEFWPREVPLAVEVRHPDWFDQGPNERDLHRLLRHFGVERVCFDSRPLFARPPSDGSTRTAQSRKPRVPGRMIGLSQSPLVRFIGRNDPDECDEWLAEWAITVAGWIREGRVPLVFCHAPDEHYAPQLARRFHEALIKELPEIPALPDWPLGSQNGEPQLGLF